MKEAVEMSIIHHVKEYYTFVDYGNSLYDIITAATGLICAFYALMRSLLATAVLWCLGYAAFYSLNPKVHVHVHVQCTCRAYMYTLSLDCSVFGGFITPVGSYILSSH